MGWNSITEIKCYIVCDIPRQKDHKIQTTTQFYDFVKQEQCIID